MFRSSVCGPTAEVRGWAGVRGYNVRTQHWLTLVTSSPANTISAEQYIYDIYTKYCNLYDYYNIKAGEQVSPSPLLYSIYNIYNGIRRGRPVAALSVIATARSCAQGGTEGGAVATAGGP